MNSASKLIKQSAFKVCGVLLLFSIFGCSKEDPNKVKGMPICFTVEQKNTKSGLMTHSFTVIGYKNSGNFLIPGATENWGGRTPIFVENYYSDGTPYNTVDQYFYDGISFYDFVAYAPLNGEGITSTVVDKESTAAPKLTFTPPAAANIDLLTACAQSHKGSSSPLNLLFSHALTRVRFSAISEYASSYSIVINDLKYTVSNKTNSIDFLKSRETKMDPESATAGVQTYTLSAIDPTPLLHEAFTPILTGVDKKEGCFYVVPQKLNAESDDALSANITVTYTISRNTDIRTKTATIKLIDILESGKDIHYQLTFSSDQTLTLKVDSDMWENFPLDNGEI